MTIDKSQNAFETTEFERQVARALPAIPRQAPRGYQEILVAYNGSADARAALDRAAATATPESEVTVVTVIPFEAISASPDPHLRMR